MEYTPLPQPQDLTKREKDDAMGAYLMMFAALAAGLPLPIINLLAAIIYYFVNKGKSRFVHFHCFQALFSQLPTTLLNAGALFWTLQTFFFNPERNDMGHITVSNYYLGYLGAVFLANVFYFIVSLVAASRARQGRFYYMLVIGQLAYHIAYKQSSEDKTYVNKPPA